MNEGVIHTFARRLSRSSGVGGPVSVLIVWSAATWASKPYSGLLISSDSCCSLIVSIVSRNCWLTWSCGLEYRSDTRVWMSTIVERERRVISRGLVW